MEPAAERLLPLLRGLEIAAPRVPIVTNVDALPAINAEEIRAALARQVASAVRWVESVERMAEMGVTEAVEIGPGAVLAGLVRRIRKEIPVAPIGKAEQIKAS
jgi:[acyl-carrier-protein] S-malonyltransferase